MWRLEAAACAALGALAGITIVATEVLRQERRTADTIRAQAYAPDLWVDDRTTAHR